HRHPDASRRSRPPSPALTVDRAPGRHQRLAGRRGPGFERHSKCAAVLGDHAGELASPVSVIAETAWLLLDRGGAAAQGRFVATITAGQLEPVDLLAADWPPDHDVYVACDL